MSREATTSSPCGSVPSASIGPATVRDCLSGDLRRPPGGRRAFRGRGAQRAGDLLLHSRARRCRRRSQYALRDDGRPAEWQRQHAVRLEHHCGEDRSGRGQQLRQLPVASAREPLLERGWDHDRSRRRGRAVPPSDRQRQYRCGLRRQAVRADVGRVGIGQLPQLPFLVRRRRRDFDDGRCDQARRHERLLGHLAERIGERAAAEAAHPQACRADDSPGHDRRGGNGARGHPRSTNAISRRRRARR